MVLTNIFAGFGGQGVLLIGQLNALCVPRNKTLVFNLVCRNGNFAAFLIISAARTAVYGYII